MLDIAENVAEVDEASTIQPKPGIILGDYLLDSGEAEDKQDKDQSQQDSDNEHNEQANSDTDENQSNTSTPETQISSTRELHSVLDTSDGDSTGNGADFSNGVPPIPYHTLSITTIHQVSDKSDPSSCLIVQSTAISDGSYGSSEYSHTANGEDDNNPDDDKLILLSCEELDTPQPEEVTINNKNGGDYHRIDLEDTLIESSQESHHTHEQVQLFNCSDVPEQCFETTMDEPEDLFIQRIAAENIGTDSMSNSTAPCYSSYSAPYNKIRKQQPTHYQVYHHNPMMRSLEDTNDIVSIYDRSTPRLIYSKSKGSIYSKSKVANEDGFDLLIPIGNDDKVLDYMTSVKKVHNSCGEYMDHIVMGTNAWIQIDKTCEKYDKDETAQHVFIKESGKNSLWILPNR